MKKQLFTALLLGAFTQSGWAAVSYDQNITAIFGGSNPDTGWTANSEAGMTLALRGKDRTTGATPNVNGVYSFATGVVPPANNRAIWNWEFSIDSGSLNTQNLQYDYFVGIDTDSSAGINFTYVNALLGWTDNSHGVAGTANGAGIEAVPNTAAASAVLDLTSTIVQQSQNLVFAGGNPLIDGTYNYELFAVAKGSGSAGTRVADVGITVVVGGGGAAVPDAGSTIALMGAAFVGIAGLRRKFNA